VRFYFIEMPPKLTPEVNKLYVATLDR